MNLKVTDDNDNANGPATLEFPGLSSIADEELADHAAADAAAAKAAAKEIQSAEGDLTDEYLEAVNHAAELICAPFPCAEPVWSTERKERLAAALARCDAAYGWGGVGSLIGHPLIGLAFAGVPLAVGTARAISAERAKAAALAGVPEDAHRPKFSAGDPMGAAASPPPPNYGGGQVVARPVAA